MASGCFAPVSSTSSQWETLPLWLVITDASAAYSPWRPVSLCSARNRRLSPSVLPSVFSANSDYPFALKPHEISVFLSNGPVEALLFGLSWERSLSLHLLVVGWGRETQHTLSVLLEETIRLPQTLQLSWIPEVDPELTKLALEHLLCKPSTYGLASYFEMW